MFYWHNDFYVTSAILLRYIEIYGDTNITQTNILFLPLFSEMHCHTFWFIFRTGCSKFPKQLLFAWLHSITKHCNVLVDSDCVHLDHWFWVMLFSTPVPVPYTYRTYLSPTMLGRRHSTDCTVISTWCLHQSIISNMLSVTRHDSN